MRVKDLLVGLEGFCDPPAAARALIFLHELSAPDTAGQPPREARWQRILDRREREWGQALDRACHACLQTWPQQLDEFFAQTAFATEPMHVVAAAVEAIGRFARQRDRLVGPWDRRTLLAAVSQELRAPGAKQAQGAFFTPWSAAEMTARMLLADDEQPAELWVLEPCVGGAVMLLAALEVYRERHGLRASRAMTLIGVDVNPQVCLIARASLLLAGADPNQFWVFTGNSLTQPIVGRDRRDGQLKTVNFHTMLTNPPFGTTVTARSLADADRTPLVIPDHVLYRTIPQATPHPAVTSDAANDDADRPTRHAAQPEQQPHLDLAA